MAKMTVIHRATVGLEDRALGQALSAEGIKSRMSGMTVQANRSTLDLGRRGNRTFEEIRDEREQETLRTALPAAVTSLPVGGILSYMASLGPKSLFAEPEHERTPRPEPKVSLSRRPRVNMAFNMQGKN